MRIASGFKITPVPGKPPSFSPLSHTGQGFYAARPQAALCSGRQARELAFFAAIQGILHEKITLNDPYPKRGKTADTLTGPPGIHANP